MLGNHLKVRIAGLLFTIAVCTLLGAVPGEGLAETETTSYLRDAALAARGRQETLLSVPSFGRYSIIAKSKQGTALQLVDRMTGPGLIAGQAGEKDGRLDLFLEQGEYKLVTLSQDKGSGQVALSASAFREQNAEPAPRLVEFRLESSSLKDFERRSYWLEVETRRTVAIEAAGRSLSDLRLWKDGNWLVDATPVAEVSEPTPGRPLNTRRLVADLSPGLYLLTAYGGPEQPWAETSDEHPLYLRYGIPRLDEAGRRRYTASPFGVDRYRVPESADYFRLELAEAEDASITVRAYDSSRPFGNFGERAEINKKSLPPVAEIHMRGRSSGDRLVTVRREAGKPYLLQHFHARRYAVVDTAGMYWVSTLHSGHGEDSIDATAVLAYRPRYDKIRFAESSTIALDRDSGWQRRFNLLEQATLFFEVKEKGAYLFEAEGVEADLRIEPFLIDKPRGYEAPEFERKQLKKDLDAGFYVLTIRPKQGKNGKGIVTLSAGPTSRGWLKRLLSPTEQKKTAAVSVRFAPLKVGLNRDYYLYLNEQPGVTTGIVVRPLPIDMSQALPVSQGAGERLTTKVRIPEPGTLAAVAEDGSRLSFSLGGEGLSGEAQVKAGTFDFSLTNERDGAVNYVLAFTPARLDPRTPLPPIEKKALDALPDFPTLTADKAHFFKAGRNEAATVNIEVGEPALYRVESTGLLNTTGTLRTRTVIPLDRQQSNGVGRNFLIGQYLREGTYQLTAQPVGDSRGHMGLRLQRTAVYDGGMLLRDIPARHTLQAGEGLLYRMRIDEAGEYHLQTLGLGRHFKVRLEDGDGWPLLRPGIRGDIRQHFEPGDYRLLILPESVEARVVTRLQRVEEEKRFEGHGPHRISLNQDVSHRWMEPVGEAERIPDQWHFSVPAAITAKIRLSRDMEGELLRETERVTRLSGGDDWSGELAPGEYRLALKSRRPNNRLDYRFSVRSEQLVQGETRVLRVPEELSIAVGSERPFELLSFGDEDVRARLFDADGKILASSDDRRDDWNFFITRQLTPGHYRLRVDPVASESATTAITMRVPGETREEPLAFPARITLRDTELHYYPLRVPEGREVLAFAVRSKDSVGLAVERREKQGWRTVGEKTGADPLLIIPLGKDTAGDDYRLRVWSVTRQGHEINVQGQAVSVSPRAEEQLTGAGVVLEPVATFEPKVGVAAVTLERPGQFSVSGKGDKLLWGAGFGAGLSEVIRDRISAAKTTLWLAGRLDVSGDTIIKARRLSLGSAVPFSTTLRPNASDFVDLAPLAGMRGAVQLVLVESPIGQPGVRPSNRSGDMAGVGPGDGSAVFIRHDPQQSVVEFWDTANQAVAMPVTLRMFNLVLPRQAVLKAGMNDVALPGISVTAFALPPGDKALRLALPAGMAAEVRAGEQTLDTVWAGREPRTFQLGSSGETLFVYNTQAGVAQLSALVSTNDGVPPLTSADFGRRHFASAGVARFRVRLNEAEKKAGRYLRIHGEHSSVIVMEDSGRILREPQPLLHDDARVIVSHGPGMLLSWLSDEAGNTAIGAPEASAQTLALPFREELKGEGAVLRLPMSSGGGVSLGVDAPVIARIKSPGLAERLRVFRNGANLPLYLPKGDNLLLLHSLSGGTLKGHALLYGMETESISEGLSDKRLLAPGDSRLYHFRLEEERAIGVGVRASVDIVSCVLMNSKGEALGRGLLQMHTLPPDDYMLRLEVPNDGETVTVQAALVGINPPDTGPPQEVIRGYLQDAGLEFK